MMRACPTVPAASLSIVMHINLIPVSGAVAVADALVALPDPH